MKIFNKTELKFSSDETSKFDGFASSYAIDLQDDIIMPGSFDNVIKSGVEPLMFINHKVLDIPVGTWSDLSEETLGLKATGNLIKQHSDYKDLRAAIGAKAMKGLSIGFSMTQDDYEWKDDIRIIHNITKLREISIVSFPANEDTRIDLATLKSHIESFGTIKEYEHYLRDTCNMSKSGVGAFIHGLKNCLRDADRKKTEDTKQLIELLKFKI